MKPLLVILLSLGITNAEPLRAIRENAEVPVTEFCFEINNPSFANACAERLLYLLQ
jgi:hypothetical protein